MAAFLVPLEPGQATVPLEKTIILVGRQSDCDVALARSKKVSRRHCCIAQVNSQFLIRDLGSTNGVFVNGTRITRETPIRMGDDVTIGDVRFRMEPQPMPAAKARPKPPAPPRERRSGEAFAERSDPIRRDAPLPMPEPIGERLTADSGPLVPYLAREASDVVPLGSDSAF